MPIYGASACDSSSNCFPFKYGHLNRKQLEELSHAEAPYIGTELRKEIPYELAFYRGTEF